VNPPAKKNSLAALLELLADDEPESKALGTAVAGGFIAAALLDVLVGKGILTNDDVRGILQRANNAVVHFYDSDIGRNAGRAISDLFRGFSE
jgi:hypothetical protein